MSASDPTATSALVRQLFRVPVQTMKAISTILAVAWVILTASSAQAQTAAGPPYARKYFLDVPPTQEDLANLPSHARDVIVAKVRLSNGGPVYLVRRDESGRPSSSVTKYLFFARIELLDVVSGPAKSGDQLGIFFATPRQGQRDLTPRTPAMIAHTYFVLIFLNPDNEHQLLQWPASEDEYNRWEAEWLECERISGRPGLHDCPER